MGIITGLTAARMQEIVDEMNADMAELTTLVNTTATNLGGINTRLETVETTLPSKVDGSGITDIVKLTQVAYDALGVKDPTTLYVVVG